MFTRPLSIRRTFTSTAVALAASSLLLPAGAGAAVNNFGCPGGSWFGDTACWSQGRSPIASDDIVLAGGPSWGALLLLNVVGNTVTAKSLTLGTDRAEATFGPTAMLAAAGSNITSNGDVQIGRGLNANANMTLSYSTLTLPSASHSVLVGNSQTGGVAGAVPGVGTLSLQDNSRIAGNVTVQNGRFDLFGGRVDGRVLVVSDPRPGFGSSAVVNIAGSVRDQLNVAYATRVNVGATQASLPTPTVGSFATGSPYADAAPVGVNFVGRSNVGDMFLANRSITTIDPGAQVGRLAGSSSRLDMAEGGQLVVQPAAVLRRGEVVNAGSIQMQSNGPVSVLVHEGFRNDGVLTGAGFVASPAGTFEHRATGFVRAQGGDLVIESRFDGRAGAPISVGADGRLFFYGDAQFKAGQVIQAEGLGRLVVFRNRVDIGTATERGALEFMVNDVALQPSSRLVLDFAGITDHDYLSTAGRFLFEGGALTLNTVGSFQAGVGSVFSLFRQMSGVVGSFSSIDTTGFAMAPGATLDLSRLYTDGTLSVVAVPEPATWLSLGAGLLFMSLYARRRGRVD